MKKALGQTVREIKREVNKKVLKVPGIEQKVLDATSNEPWGPHGSLLADIAQATRNYHEYQMIMTVIWKRINDTGKNWRHVYKALTVLEFLVAHGSERVIDEIREHAYQISTLSDFQYIDSSGRDQGSNVRKKSQSLVVLVNDKERIQEVRQKAAANRDKFRSTSLGGGMYRPGSYSSAGGYGDRYDDDRYEGRYGSRDDDRNGYGRERETSYGDDDRYGRYGDSYGRDGDRYGRDSEDYRGRSQSIDEDQYGSRSRSSDRDKDRSYEEDGQFSSRGSGAQFDDAGDGRQLEQKSSEQNLGAPPSYEEAVGDAQITSNSQRDGETSKASPKASPPVSASSNQVNATPGTSAASVPAAAANKEVDGFDEFDPRSSFPAAPTTSSVAETDLLGSLSESFSSNALALVPATFATSEADASAISVSGPAFVASPSAAAVMNLPLEDPFGDSPFKAIPSTDSFPVQSQTAGVISSHHPSTNQISEPSQPAAQKAETINDFADTFPGISYTSSSVQIPSTNSHISPQEMTPIDQNIDILADILPPSGYSPPTTSQVSFAAPSGQPASQSGFMASTGQPTPVSGLPAPTGHPASMSGFPAPNGLHLSLSGLPAQSGQPVSLTNFPPQGGQPASQTGFLAHTAGPVPQSGFPPHSSQPAFPTGFPTQIGTGPQAGFLSSNGHATQPSTSLYGGFPQLVSTAPVAPQMASQVSTEPTAQLNPANILPVSSLASSIASQGPQTPIASQPALTASTGSLTTVAEPAKKKFEPKSAVWADTLSRGLVNLNISGPKTNPLADIGIDFEAINRKEKRMEKPSTAPGTSTVTMGKAMGSGSGIGRAGAGALRAPPSAMIGSGMGMGMGMGGGPGMGMGMGMGVGGGPSVGASMGGYGGMSQPMGMGTGLSRPMNMGMGMNMGIGQGVQMQPPAGFPPGSAMSGGYNPMMGAGGHVQTPYGGGYR